MAARGLTLPGQQAKNLLFVLMMNIKRGFIFFNFNLLSLDNHIVQCTLHFDGPQKLHKLSKNINW